MRIIEFNPHDKEPFKYDGKVLTKVFLAGSIDNGNSYNWQKEYIENMRQIARDVNYRRKNEEGFNADEDIIIIYNPRREDFPKDNYAELDYQINWELDHLNESDMIYMEFLPESKSPITLMELGLYANSGKLKVTCPVDFYRYENVKVVCDRYGIPYRNTIKDNFEITVL